MERFEILAVGLYSFSPSQSYRQLPITWGMLMTTSHYNKLLGQYNPQHLVCRILGATANQLGLISYGIECRMTGTEYKSPLRY